MDNEETIDAAELMEAEVVKVVEVVREPRKPRAPKAAAAVPAEGMPPRVKIILEENDDIPPTGLPLGHNGTHYLLMPGVVAEVPEFLLGILENAVTSRPERDPHTKQILGWRDRLRYPYRIVR